MRVQTTIKHNHDTGQYTCMSCGGRNTAIAGEAISTYQIQWHHLIQTVALVYVGKCENCDGD